MDANYSSTNIRADVVLQVAKGMKDNNCKDKIFSGEVEPTSEKFLNWLNNLSDEAIAVDARLADWFSLSVFEYDREQKLIVDNKEADGQIFQLIKKYLTGSALDQVEAMKAHRSGRTCILDLVETHIQDFSGEAAKLQEEIDNVHFSEDVNPTNELVRIITAVSKLTLVQQHRKRPAPDMHDICLKVVKALQPYNVYSEIKMAESTNPGMPELHDLFLLRTWCNVRYKLWVQNGGRGPSSNKRSLNAIQGEEVDMSEESAELCAFQRHAGKPGSYFKGDEARKQQRQGTYQGPYKAPQGGNPGKRTPRACTFCKGRAVKKGLQITPELLAKITHRFDACPLLSQNRELMEDLKALDNQPRLQCLEEQSELFGMADTTDMSADFCAGTDGWGHGRDPLEDMANPVNNHPLARTARQGEERAILDAKAAEPKKP